jgi:cytochrome c oxidase assembly factor CtaG
MNIFSKVAEAANNSSAATDLIILKIVDNIISPIVQFMFVLATFMFIWGIIGYIMGGEDPERRKTGQTHILWGLVGMAIMISAYGIVRFVFSSLGQTATF